MYNDISGVNRYRDYSNTSKNNQKFNNELNKDAFLRLLTTQLKNQDPLKPMEDREFIAQMAQFTSLEQMQNLNETVKSNNQTMLEHLASMNNNMVKSQSSILQTLEEINKSIKNINNKPEQTTPNNGQASEEAIETAEQ
ncbi:flagellar hook assembly protein FlgD [Serpentinicella alkaliphila]|uniref:Flagellar basal-body rod modification protein FlgD n=1 Tax=Serpentinicella alkaliphila TaxID=1734049 RepID=A0A4R2TQI3_9FIRM|nr:flagellar hook capping FlgD N-terminal domain-containing protein [Serpentinicella alkaliphila]QUH26281.1 flagellar hook capping protein [Serpentinicella alkaliphila]TCQ05861.1 flagellar basal-body rod modification protein FlgD [Serpentinicella alkaliphila]